MVVILCNDSNINSINMCMCVMCISNNIININVVLILL